MNLKRFQRISLSHVDHAESNVTIEKKNNYVSKTMPRTKTYSELPASFIFFFLCEILRNIVSLFFLFLVFLVALEISLSLPFQIAREEKLSVNLFLKMDVVSAMNAF